MQGSLDDIQEAIRINCCWVDPGTLREVLFAGIANRCGHSLVDISAHLRSHDCTFLISMFEKRLSSSRAENSEYCQLRMEGQPFVVTPTSALYRKFVLINNYLSILSICENASHRRISAR